MREADHRGFGDRLVQHEGAFHFGRAHAVPRDVHHVVDASGDPVVAVRVASRAVAGEVEALVGSVVGVDHPLMVAVDRADLARPRCRDDQVAGCLGLLDDLAVAIHERGLHTEERLRRGTRLEICDARKGCDHDAAGLGLPPGVDDGAATFADDAVVPLPGLGIDRFAHRAQELQALPRGARDVLVALRHELPDGRWRGIEDVHLVLVHDLPTPGRVGICRHALEHQRCRTVGQRPVDDVRVACDPADVGRAPVDVAVVVVEDVLVRHGSVEHVPTRAVLDALRLAGGPRRIEDEQRILGRHDRRFEGIGLAAHEFVVPDVPSLAPGHVAASSLHGQDGMHARTVGQGGLGVLLERDGAPAAQTLVRGDQRLAVRIEDPVLERLR